MVNPPEGRLRGGSHLRAGGGQQGHYGKALATPDAKVTLSKAALDAVQLKEKTLQAARDAGDIKIDGRREALAECIGLLDQFPAWFNIVTP